MPREIRGITPRKSKINEPYKCFVIASEGADTERIYFQEIQSHYQRTLQIKLVEISFLERKGEEERRKSGHIDILKQLDAYKKRFQIDKQQDEFWVVMDRDSRNNPLKNIDKIAQICSQKKYQLAISNPKFEFWLLLHLKDITEFTIEERQEILESKKINANRDVLEKLLSELLQGYDKSKYNVEMLVPKIPFAIQQAKSLDTKPNERWPENELGSRVYRLMANILEAITSTPQS